MKFIITGGAGFIGSHIADLLIEKGHDVIIIDNLSSTDGSMRNIEGKELKFYEEDIVQRDKMIEIFNIEKPDIVFHLAAQISVSVSMKDPGLDHKVNVIGSRNIIDASIASKAKKIIFSGTVAIYGDDYKKRMDDVLSKDISYLEQHASKEEYKYDPLSPYAKNKLKVIEMLKSQDKIDWTALLYGNVYGPRQDPHGEAGVVAIFCQKMIKDQNPEIFGDGICIRDFVFCKDVADANLKAVEKGNGEIINIGTGKGTDIKTLFSTIKKITGYAGEGITRPFRRGDILVSILDIKRAEEVLGWRPKTSLHEGLIQTVDYFKK